MGDELQRRAGDRDAMLTSRFDQITDDMRTVDQKVTALDTSVAIVKTEQAHIRELVSARLSTIEKSQELQLSVTNGLAAKVDIMMSDVDKSPLGRTLHGLIATIADQVDKNTITITVHEKWQDRVDGVLNSLRWIGAGGSLAALIGLARWMHILP